MQGWKRRGEEQKSDIKSPSVWSKSTGRKQTLNSNRSKTQGGIKGGRQRKNQRVSAHTAALPRGAAKHGEEKRAGKLAYSFRGSECTRSGEPRAEHLIKLQTGESLSERRTADNRTALESQKTEPGYHHRDKTKSRVVPGSNSFRIQDRGSGERTREGRGRTRLLWKWKAAQCKSRGAEQIEYNGRQPLMMMRADHRRAACRRKSKTSHSPRLPEQQRIERFLPASAWKAQRTGPVLGSMLTGTTQDNQLPLSCAKPTFTFRYAFLFFVEVMLLIKSFMRAAISSWWAG